MAPLVVDDRPGDATDFASFVELPDHNTMGLAAMLVRDVHE